MHLLCVVRGAGVFLNMLSKFWRIPGDIPTRRSVPAQVFDGVTGGLQKRVKAATAARGVKPKPYDYMFWTNAYPRPAPKSTDPEKSYFNGRRLHGISTSLLRRRRDPPARKDRRGKMPRRYMLATALVFALGRGEVARGLEFAFANPEIWGKLLRFAGCSAVGQSFIFFTIAKFDPLVRARANIDDGSRRRRDSWAETAATCPADDPRRGRGVDAISPAERATSIHAAAATRPHGISTRQPRPVPTEYPRGSRGGAATRPRNLSGRTTVDFHTGLHDRHDDAQDLLRAPLHRPQGPRAPAHGLGRRRPRVRGHLVGRVLEAALVVDFAFILK